MDTPLDNPNGEDWYAAGSFSARLGHVEAELALVLAILGAFGLLIATMWCIPSMYYYDTPRLSPSARLLVAVGMAIATAAEICSVPWLGRRMRSSSHPQPVSTAANVTVRWWPARLVLAGWWMANAGAVFWLTDQLLEQASKLQLSSAGQRAFVYATYSAVVFSASFLSTVYVLIGLGFAGLGRVWLMRLYRARVLIDLGIAAIALVGGEIPRSSL